MLELFWIGCYKKLQMNIPLLYLIKYSTAHKKPIWKGSIEVYFELKIVFFFLLPFPNRNPYIQKMEYIFWNRILKIWETNINEIFRFKKGMQCFRVSQKWQLIAFWKAESHPKIMHPEEQGCRHLNAPLW